MVTQKEMIDAIKPLVDDADLATVVIVLSLICHEKAEDCVIADDPLAGKAWDRAAAALKKAALDKAIENVSLSATLETHLALKGAGLL